MPRFDYYRAKQDGVSDEEILSFLDSERSQGREYDIDRTALSGLNKARANVMASQEPGLEANPWNNPVEALVGSVNPGRMIQAGPRMIGQLLSRDIPRAAQGIGSAVSRIGGKKVAEAGMDVATGGKTAALRTLGNIFRREAPGPASVPMPPGATAVPSPGGFSPGGFSAPTVAGEVAQEVGTAASRTANEASEAGRALSRQRWAKAPKPKPKGKVVGKIEPKPKVGSAESRVKETLPERAAKNRQRQKDNRRSPQMRQQPQIKPPEGDLMEQLQRSLKAEKAMEQLGLSEAEKEVARKLLIQGQ